MLLDAWDNLLWNISVQIFGWWPNANDIAPWKCVGSESQLTANLHQELHAFGSYYIEHLPRDSKLVEITTLDDRGLEAAFHDQPQHVNLLDVEFQIL